MYLAIGLQINDEENKGFYAFAVPITESDNVCFAIDRYNSATQTVMHANIFTTKKKTREVVEAWNEAYKRNGTYAFSPCW